MNIRDLNPLSGRTDRSRSTSAGSAAKGADGSPSRINPEMQQKGPADRVEISDAARAAQAQEEQARLREVAMGRKAILGIPPLSQERVEEILKRVKNGYYHTPEAGRAMAEKAAGAMLGSDEQ